MPGNIIRRGKDSRTERSKGIDVIITYLSFSQVRQLRGRGVLIRSEVTDKPPRAEMSGR